MEQHEQVNILLVDDQPAKLLSYEVVLRDLNENLIKAASATEALEILLRNEIAVILVDVCMPDLDGFELAAMIRNHPRFQRTAIIFISAIHLTDTDYLRGYEMGAVDYVPVPVVPELLRAKVRVFAELYRKSRQLELFNQELERRVAERTAELQSSAERLRESERSRSIALAAGQMGSWEWDVTDGACSWDDGQYRIFGVEPDKFTPRIQDIEPFINADDFKRIQDLVSHNGGKLTFQTEVRVSRPNGEIRSCICAASMTPDVKGDIARVSLVMIDITDRKQAEERQLLLAREVDHRARNALAVVQAIVRLTRNSSPQAYVKAVEGRIHALAKAHTLLSETRWQGADIARLAHEELAPYRSGDSNRVQIDGPTVLLPPEKAQNLALALHELATNSAKYGALSSAAGALKLRWQVERNVLTLHWEESGGPPVKAPSAQGFGTKIMNASIKHQIGGNVAWNWRTSGLHCTLQIPIGVGGGQIETDADQKNESFVQLPAGKRKRVLLVEDEAIVGMMMRDILLEHNLFVVGPCASLHDAMSAASSRDYDCAILDLNLGGDSVYPVAMLLTEHNIPFAFLTGYGRESIDHRFADTPTLQKPVVRELLEEYLRQTLGADSVATGKNTPNWTGGLEPPSAITA